MNRSLKLAAVFLAAATVSAAALAEGAYVGRGGSNLLGAVPQTAQETAAHVHARKQIGAFGAFGYRWADGFGAEIEGGLRQRQLDGDSLSPNGRSAEQNTATLMLNARIAPSFRGPLSPYAGVGAGVAVVNTADHSLRSDDGAVAPAGQAVAGFNLNLSDRSSLFAEYRYFKLLEDGDVATPNGANDRNDSHAAMFGLRIRLGADLAR